MHIHTIVQITAYGMHYVERERKLISNSDLQKREEERKLILEKLYEYTKENTKKFIKKEDLEKLTDLDENTLWNHLNYLDVQGLVEFKPSSGPNFRASITSNGIDLVERGMVKSIIRYEESSTFEFKSSLGWDYELKKPKKELAKPVLKTFVAFMNTEGGTLIIGVDDNKNILGIENDFKDLKDWDHWHQTLVNYINNRIGKEFHQFIRIEKEEVDGKIIAKINVKPSNRPVYLDQTQFYIRAANTSLRLNNDQIEKIYTNSL